MGYLTEDQSNQFNDEGFLVLRQWITIATLPEHRSRMVNDFYKTRGTLEPHPVSPACTKHRGRGVSLWEIYPIDR